MPSSPIELGSAQDIPRDIEEQLYSFMSRFKDEEFQEPLLESSSIIEIVSELNELANKYGVAGYHYTRSFTSSIHENGLIIRSGVERRNQFLEEHGHLFTSFQLERLKHGWNEYFNNEQNRVRDHRIWFNLTTKALNDGGAAPLLENYGGEVVYMPFSRDEEILQILGQLGEPLVVKCSLDTRTLTTFSQEPWGKVLLSSYHRSVNPDAYHVDYDVYSRVTVPSDKIMEIKAAQWS